jgi:hypothetical protein
MVTLSVHGFVVPAVASVLKFSVSGEPSVVMLPLLVIADEGRTITATAIAVTRNKDKSNTRRVARKGLIKRIDSLPL